MKLCESIRATTTKKSPYICGVQQKEKTMKKMFIALLTVCFAASMVSCQSGSRTACKSKGYKVWYCGYERPQSSYRAMLR